MLTSNPFMYLLAGTAVAGGAAAGVHFVFKDEASTQTSITNNSLLNKKDDLNALSSLKDDNNKTLSEKTAKLHIIQEETKTLNIQKSLLAKANELLKKELELLSTETTTLSKDSETKKANYEAQEKVEKEEQQKLDEAATKKDQAESAYNAQKQIEEKANSDLTAEKDKETKAKEEVTTKTQAKTTADNAVATNQTAIQKHKTELVKASLSIPSSILGDFYSIFFSSTTKQVSTTDLLKKIKTSNTNYKAEVGKTTNLISQQTQADAAVKAAIENEKTAAESVKKCEEELKTEKAKTTPLKTALDDSEKEVARLTSALTTTKESTKNLLNLYEAAKKALEDKEKTTVDKPTIASIFEKLKHSIESEKSKLPSDQGKEEELKRQLMALNSLTTTWSTDSTTVISDADNSPFTTKIGETDSLITNNSSLIKLINDEIGTLNTRISTLDSEILSLNKELETLA